MRSFPKTAPRENRTTVRSHWAEPMLPALVYYGRIPVLWGAGGDVSPSRDRLAGPVLTGAGGDVSPPSLALTRSWLAPCP